MGARRSREMKGGSHVILKREINIPQRMEIDAGRGSTGLVVKEHRKRVNAE